ncbi:protein TIC 56, chloroplastic [Tanacetum coccineum]
MCGKLADSDNEGSQADSQDESLSDIDSKEERPMYGDTMEELMEEAYEKYLTKKEGTSEVGELRNGSIRSLPICVRFAPSTTGSFSSMDCKDEERKYSNFSFEPQATNKMVCTNLLCIDLELAGGTLGGQVTTVEGLITKISENKLEMERRLSCDLHGNCWGIVVSRNAGLASVIRYGGQWYSEPLGAFTTGLPYIQDWNEDFEDFIDSFQQFTEMMCEFLEESIHGFNKVLDKVDAKGKEKYRRRMTSGKKKI